MGQPKEDIGTRKDQIAAAEEMIEQIENYFKEHLI